MLLANATLRPPLAVPEPPSGGGSEAVLFFSDFASLLGTSDAAQQDGVSPTYKWDFLGGATNDLEVIESTGLDFPSAHCLKVPLTPSAFNLIRNTQMPVLAVGERRTFRWYYRCAMPTSDARMAQSFPPGPGNDWNYHPIQDGFAGTNCNWAFETNTNEGTEWLPWFFLGNGNVPDGYQRWFMPNLPKNETYRFELQLYRNTTSTFQLDVAVYNSSNIQVADNSDFTNAGSGFPLYDLTTVRGNVPTHGDFPFNDVNNTNGLNAGTNDTFTVTPADPVIIQCYEGCFAVVDNVPAPGWIGPYGSVAGEAQEVVVFQSDFSAATGTSSTAYLDGGAWDRRGGFGQEVVASTGLDFPSTNVCRFDANYSNSGFCLTQVDLTALAVGVTRYHRLYVRMTFPDELVGNGDHPWQDGNAVGDSNYLLGVGYGSADSPTHDGDWRLSVIIIEDLGSIICVGPWLAKGTTYRVEWAVERIDTSTYNFDIRVYDTAGVLLYGSSDFAPQFGGGTLASRGPYTFKAAQEASPGDFFNCGTNDFETAGNDWWNAAPYSGVFAYGYQGCFAILDRTGTTAAGTWVGPYGAVPGETQFTPMFVADFGTALGITEAAIGDGGVFDTMSPDFEDNGEVIVADPAEKWKTANVLKVYSAAGVRDGYLEPKHTTLGEMAENEVRNFRFAVVNKTPNYAGGATDYSHHGIQDGYPVGSGTYQNWSLTDVTGSNIPATDATFETQWQARVIINGPDQFELDSTVTPTKLNKHEKYTFDYQIVRGSGANTNAFQIRVWVYDSNDFLIKGPSDWKSSNWPGETMATGRWYTFNNRASTTSVGFGLNGILGTFPLYHSNQGEIAVVSSLDNARLVAGMSIGVYPSCVGEG